MEQLDRTAERILGEIAFGEKGIVTRVAALRAGVTPQQLRVRLESGALLLEFRGVYRLGHRAPSIEATYLAAVRACGEGSLLCGPAAMHLYDLIKGEAPEPHVLAPKERRIEGIAVIRSRHAHPLDATSWRGVPVTTIPRTLIDITPTLTLDELAKAFHEASVRYKVTVAHVEAALARRPNSPGAATLRAVLRGDMPITLSVLEQRFLALLTSQDLPLPGTNRRVGNRYVDCRWPAIKLIVELDSYRYHGSRHAWEQDRKREREARALGHEFRRYTYGDVCESPQLMLDELRLLLG